MSKNRVTYPELKRRLDRLAISLLPADKPAGDYSEEDKDRIHGYLLLAHAEIENFVEKLALFAADQAKRKSSATQCAPIISRLIFFKSIQSKDKIDAATEDTMTSACAFFTKIIERNNGIKSGNILQIFMPLGLTHGDLDPVLMANLDAFGILRGDIAHTAARLRQGSSPSSERLKVTNLLRDLAHFDQSVRGLI